ncbi:MAG: ABC transporter ATP-binding protein [Cyclobacteriaceae bacterium]|nr:ABC transporter ATP-binding protein [Cyclobacteriaceae bacterium]
MNALETSALTYRYGPDKVLDNVNLVVSPGTIYGFLGPNGAGKTTTLKLATGLLRMQEGAIHIFGQSMPVHRIEILRSIGTLIESPSLYAHLTARENLLLYQKLYRCPSARITETLERVGLARTGSKKAGQFSLGMKQRLSIAIALLHSPRLLILDEPTNGLDPSGIIEVRELLKQLTGQEGLTVLISSHLLAEIERLVTHIGIIHKGRLVFQGTMDELHMKQRHSSGLLLGTDNPEGARHLLSECGIEAVPENGHLVLPDLPSEKMAEITRQLVARDIGVYRIEPKKNDLEQIFINLVND